MNSLEYLKTTAKLMAELRIAVRDTFSFDSVAEPGIGQLNIEWIETDGFTEMKSKYCKVPGRKSMGYESANIRVPARFRECGRDDVIVHECVHFLQHNTLEEDRQYIQFSGPNYVNYLSQRVELEAHLIQVAYLSKGNSEHWNSRMDEGSKAVVATMLDKVRHGEPLAGALPTLLMCKGRGLL